MANEARSNLRIADLKQRQPTSRRLINVRIPAHQADAIARLADQLGTSKSEVIVALLNAGLEAAGRLKR
jgi:GH24 family phage-related lysozyme (muramidase)